MYGITRHFIYFFCQILCSGQAWVKYVEYLYLVVFKYFFQYLYLYLNVSSRKYFVFVFKYIPIVFETTKIHSKYPASYYIRALINLAVILLDSPVSLQLPF